MKIEAIAVGSHGVDLIPSDRHWEGQHFSCRTTEMRDEWIRLINAGQALIEQEKIVAKEWWPKKDAVCNMCGGKGVVSVPCPDAKPGSSITCGVLHYGPCPACAPAAERAERYGKLRDKLDEWTDADTWEQRRWELARELFAHAVKTLATGESAKQCNPKVLPEWCQWSVKFADALIAEFRKGEKCE